MTLITDMGLPYDVVNAGREAMHRAICENDYFTAADAAIRAALQAMCDCGMATLDQDEYDRPKGTMTIRLAEDMRAFAIRLDTGGKND